MICELIRKFREEKPEARQIMLTRGQHETLCNELVQQEGRPIRVLMFDGLRVRIIGDA